MTIYYVSRLGSTFSPVHTASSTLWGQLGSALQTIGQGRDIYLNDLGENPPSGFTPYAVADKIKNGAVWIDWCGFPFYASYGSAAAGQLLGALGFNSSVDFNMSDVGDTNPSTRFERSLILAAPMQSPGIINTATPHGTAQEMHYGIYASGNRYWYSSFAVKAGRGAYIYGFGNNSSFGVLGIGGYTTGISLSQFSPFVKQIIASLPAPTTIGTSPPSCPQWGSYMEAGTEAGTWTFGETSNGVLITRVVNQQCQVVPNGGPFYHQVASGSGLSINTGGASSSSGGTVSSGGSSAPQGGSSVSYASVKASVNGTAVPAIVVNGSTYLSYAATTALGVQWNINKQCVTYNGVQYCNYDGTNPAMTVGGTPGNWQFTYSGGGLLSGSSSKLLIVGGVALGGVLFWQYTTRRRA